MKTKGKGRQGDAVTANQSKAACGPTPSIGAKNAAAKVNFGQLGNALTQNLTNSLNKPAQKATAKLQP